MPRTPTQYWLMKSEPAAYAIEDLERDGFTEWDGIRNYQARNFMRDRMKVGDRVLFYHSNANPPGVAGLARISRGVIPDPTARDPDSPYYDPRETEEAPRWMMVQVAFVERFPALVPLSGLRESPALEGMLVTRRGQRLSIQPVEPEHFRTVVRMGRRGRPSTP